VIRCNEGAQETPTQTKFFAIISKSSRYLNMNKYSIILLLSVFGYHSFAQTTLVLIRHDTTLLQATECNWIIKSLDRNDQLTKSQNGKSIPLIILEEIEKGNLKAFDFETNKAIPSKEIFTWKMGKDSILVNDSTGGSNKLVVIQNKLNPDKISRIRIFHDWYFNPSTGKIQSTIKGIELIEDITNSSGTFVGYKPFCRIE
jgi:Gliding motility associated protein GldN